MIKPNFFLVGAPKCGTTTVYDWISQHPEVYMSENKEPHFFYSPHKSSQSFDQYLDNFSEAEGGGYKIIGEASVWYLFSESAAEKIINFNPLSKFIVCLRNPLEMAPSLHAQLVYNGHELEKKFDAAWALSEKRENGVPVKVFDLSGGDVTHMSYRKACMLGSQVNSLLKAVPRESVLFIFIDDLKNDPGSVWRDIKSFLDIDNGFVCSFEKKNSATARRSVIFNILVVFLNKIKKKVGVKYNFGFSTFLKKVNTVDKIYDKPGDSTIEMMRCEFELELVLLESLVGRLPSGWKHAKVD